MNIVDLTAQKADPKYLLEMLEDMRQDVLSGKLIAFVAVGFDADDAARMWSARIAGGHVSRLRMLGAISALQHDYHVDQDTWSSKS